MLLLGAEQRGAADRAAAVGDRARRSASPCWAPRSRCSTTPSTRSATLPCATASGGRRAQRRRCLRSPAAAEPLLQVRGLTVEYDRRPGRSARSTTSTSTSRRGEFVGVVGESGCGKSTMLFGDRPAAQPAGADQRRQRDLQGPRPGHHDRRASCGAVRWRDFSVVMQSAMNALNPVSSSAPSSRTRCGRTASSRRRRSRQRSDEVLRAGRHRPGAPAQLPAPAQRRHAAAGDDRDGPAVHARPDHHGRADVRPRRRRPALADGADQGAAAAARLRGHLRHPRHVAGQPLLRPAASSCTPAQVAEIGATRGRVRQPAHPYTQGLLDAFPSIRGPRVPLTGIPGSPPDLLHPPAGCRFAPRCPHALRALRRRAAAVRRRRGRCLVRCLPLRRRAWTPERVAATPDGTETEPLAARPRGLTRHFRVGGAIARQDAARRRRRRLHHRPAARSSRWSARAAAARAPSRGCWPASTSRRRARSTTRAGR